MSEESVNAAVRELNQEEERGEWSGLRSTSGSPIFTLREIAEAVVRELYREHNASP